MKINLQIPIDKTLRDDSERIAREYGYSSLQDAVRMFLTQLASKTISITFSSREADEYLTEEQEVVLTKKYIEAKKEIQNKKNYSAQSVDELLKNLNK